MSFADTLDLGGSCALTNDASVSSARGCGTVFSPSALGSAVQFLLLTGRICNLHLWVVGGLSVCGNGPEGYLICTYMPYDPLLPKKAVSGVNVP